MGWMPLEEDAREILKSSNGVEELHFVELVSAAELTLAGIGVADVDDAR